MEKIINIEGKKIRLLKDLDPVLIDTLEMGDGMGNFFHYRYRSARKTREVLASVCSDSDNLVSGAVVGRELIGYVTLVRPEDGTYWDEIDKSMRGGRSDVEWPLLLELGSIEVSVDWRSKGVGREMLRFVFDSKDLEEKIVFIRELSWHWDLQSVGLTVYQYRSMLLRLFEPVGFRYYDTGDQEITYAGENMLLVRVGKDVSPQVSMKFYNLISGSRMGGWGWG